jgi:anti-sigma regulatory factor (Ser/Thr protein kinase)
VTAPVAEVPTVRISFTPDPAYVRAVRTVAVAVARRAGVADDRLDEVRLAIGEACTRAVGVHRREGRIDPVEVAMSLAATERGRAGRFTVGVTDQGSADAARKEQAGGTGEIVARATVAPSGEDTGRSLLDEELLTIRVGLALLAGLAADLVVDDAPGGVGTEVRMSWPVDGAPAQSRAGRAAATRQAPRAKPRRAKT